MTEGEWTTEPASYRELTASFAELAIPSVILECRDIRDFYHRWFIERELLGTVKIKWQGWFKRWVIVRVSFLGMNASEIIKTSAAFGKSFDEYRESIGRT